MKYNGEMQNFVPHGEGRMDYENNAFYEGTWHAGQKHGYGRYHYPDNSEYVG